MGRLFGTDGIRGIAGGDLSVELAVKVGRAAAAVLAAGSGKKPLVLIGKDTRISSDMLENALTAGLCSAGADVMRLGVIPTPAVACLSLLYGADAGVVISASHNPFEYNGIKIFNGDGYKLSDELEDSIERYVLEDAKPVIRTHGDLGVVLRGEGDHCGGYIRHLLRAAEGGYDGIRAVIDCANGAASETAPKLFGELGLKAEYIFHEPDGKNINAGCGSTQLDRLKQRVAEGGFDIGIAFDGDADRCLIVDEKGGIVDGDKIMGVCALSERESGRLFDDTIVATVMSNMGFHVFCRERGIKLICTDVGDRHVLEKMLEGGYAIGGEQSGHLIFSRFATTGDGQLAALRFLQCLSESGGTVSELAGVIPEYPQVLINTPVSSDEEKHRKMSDQRLKTAVETMENGLSGKGRVLVRPSGTEALIRVMVEAEDKILAEQTALKLTELIKAL